jgi:outer membrane protein assembly factor BamA
LLCLACAACAQDAALGRPYVHKVYIHGNEQIKSGAIKGRIATEATSWSPFSPKKYLDHPFMTDVDKERIEAYYRSRGFFSARVSNVAVVPYDEDGVDVHFHVEEGAPSRISGVDLQGLSELTPRRAARIRRLVKLRQGEIFTYTDYVNNKEEIARALRQMGYAWAEVDGLARVNRDTHAVEVVLRIVHRRIPGPGQDPGPGPRAVFGEVRVRGTRRVDPRLVARHAAIRPGQRFTQSALDLAQGRLYDLGMFASVQVEHTPDPRNPGVADVLIIVSEGRFHEVRLGVGLGLESLRTEARVRAVYSQLDFLGGLRTLTATAEAGYAALPAFWASPIERHGPVVSVSGRLTQPDVLGPFSTLRADLSYNLGIEYAYQFHGPRLQLGAQRSVWRNRLTFALSASFEFLDFFFTNAALSEDPVQAQVLYGYVDPYRLGALQQDITLDLRDRQLDARRGGYFGLHLQEGGPYVGGAFWFEKIMPDVRGYLPLGSRVVLAGRAMFGQIFVQGDLSSPISGRFYLGGPNSHRGFSYNRLSPQVCSVRMVGAPVTTAMEAPACEETPQVGENYELTRLPIGGDQMLLVQAEMRVNLFQLYGGWLGAVAFFDAGDVALPRCTGPCRLPAYLSTVDLTRLHLAAGGGLRYQTVVGTIRADLGVRLNRLKDSYAVRPDGSQVLALQNPDPGQRFAFHISIGEAF